jgi:hypothetical protein
VVKNFGSIEAALGDEVQGRAAILMHLTAMVEQFDKLLHAGELEVKILG